MPRFDLVGLPTQWVIVWLVIGAAVGALVATLLVRRQRRVTRREHVVQLRRREAAIDRLKNTIKEHADRIRHQDDELRELGLVRRERVTLGGDLDQARRTVAELQHSVDSTRAAARETDEAELRRRARKLALILMAASASLVIALIVGALLFL